MKILCAVAIGMVFVGCNQRADRDTGGTRDTATALISGDGVQADTVTGNEPGDTSRQDTTSAAAHSPSGLLITPSAGSVPVTGEEPAWFVLRQRGAVTELIRTRVDTMSTTRPCNDTGLAVKPIAINGPWIAILANLPGLRPGAVEAAALLPEATAARSANDSAAFTFRGESFVIQGTAVSDSTYSVVFDGKGGRMTIGDPIRANQRWRIVWAGDLNRDGAPELILETTNEQSKRLIAVYMSGLFPPGANWLPSAQETHRGCQVAPG